MNEKIETLQNQVNSLQDKIRDLKTTLENPKYILIGTLQALKETKTIQHSKLAWKSKRGLICQKMILKSIWIFRKSYLWLNSKLKKPSQKASQMPLKAILRHFRIVSNIIYPRMKRKGVIGKISSLWERFQTKRRLKLLN